MEWNRSTLARTIDHTLLKPDARAEAIRTLCEEAVRHHFYSVCVHSGWVAYCREQLQGSDVRISAVCGFPHGANGSEVKAYEAAQSVKWGAAEIDMVLPIGMLLDHRFTEVEADIRQVVAAVEGQAVVKVILETGYLNSELVRAGCRLAEQAGAGFVKTSTGFGPGGATAEVVRLMRESVSSSMGVKASGGVRDAATAIAMLEAGATRIGTSSGIAIVSGLQGMEDY
nr:deoxyribose-phosphate aldolase [Aneurinibacillus sp. XH2]